MDRDRGGAVIRRHVCEWCRKPFMSSRAHARFDSVACRVAHHRWVKGTALDYQETKRDQRARLEQVVMKGFK